jgi:predicted lysophospholipase L1 biosynthesis ABC-type transport system permease subunit
VGTTIVNDTFEASPGRGAAVAPAFIAEATPEGSPDPVVVRAAADVPVADLETAFAAVHEGSILEPRPQGAVNNLSRIRHLPFLMAGFVAVLALASLVHALVLVTARNRRALGMLKGLGFVQREIAATVLWHATTYALVALVVAVPLGIIAGRWGWRTIAAQVGVPAVAVVPPLAVAGVALVALVLADLAAAYPAWRAARMPISVALRSD